MSCSRLVGLTVNYLINFFAMSYCVLDAKYHAEICVMVSKSRQFYPSAEPVGAFK